MENRKKISIIMGIYNCGKTLKLSIESLLNQTYKDWELIMCDDGSTDNTNQIASRFADEYDNIYLIQNKKNMGLSYTLNRCLMKARGDFVARMDGDDISLPLRLEKEVSFLERNSQYAFVSSSAIYFDENGDFGLVKGNEKPTKVEFARKCPFVHPASIIRKSAYDSVGGYSVGKKLLRVEDYHLWIKMYAKGYRGYNIQEPLYKVRDDREAVKRRHFIYRINEVYVKFLAIKMLKLPFYNYIFVLKPIAVGLLPTFIYKYLHRRRLKKRYFKIEFRDY